jgi:hypothetical protein
MKTLGKFMYFMMGLTVGAALLLAAGCSKQEKPAGDANQTTTPTASEAPKAAEVPKPAAAATSPAGAASQDGAAVADSTSQTQGLIEKAKGLVTDEKYKDALAAVRQLSSLRLTPEQRTLVDGLKAQIQTALGKSTTSDAASAVDNVLGGKK